MKNDFRNYAVKHLGMSSTGLDDFSKESNKSLPIAGYLSPTIIEERHMNVASMDVFSRLMMDRIIWLGVGIDEYVASVIQGQLLYLASVDAKRDIQIYLSCPGGRVHDGLSIIDVMDYIEPDVATICTSMAASMAAVILANGSKGKRSALKHSRVMIHQVSGGFQGTYSDMEINLRETLKLKKELYDILSITTGNSYDKIEKDCDRDYWMTSIEAKEYGIIDEILEKS